MALGLSWSLFCLGIFIVALVADRMGIFSSKNHFPVNGRTIVITGGSTGMGRSVGRMLAAKGANVTIVARNLDKLKEGISYIAQGALNPQTQRFHSISADLTNPSESPRVIAEATALNNGAPPDIVWCCAGTSHPTLFVQTSTSELKRQMDSNYFTSAYMAHAILNAWLKPSPKSGESNPPRASEPRHLIFTASFLAFFTFTGYTSYSPTKTALRSLSDTLSQEMNLYRDSHTPVSLHTIFPAGILTESFVEENKVKSDVTKKLEEDDKGQTPDEVARWSIKGLERGEELVTTTWLTRLVMTSVLGGSKRNGWALLDTLLSWVMSLAMIFVRGDLDGKVKTWGRQYGQSGMKG